MSRGCDVHGMHATTFEAEKCARGMSQMRRVLSAYGRVHPSMYPFMVWRLSEANAKVLVEEAGLMWPKSDSMGVRPNICATQILGMPVEFVDSDEILLVLKA